MKEQIIFSMKAPYREDFQIKGYSFGKCLYFRTNPGK